MPSDANLALQASVTRTFASTTVPGSSAGSGVTIRNTPRRGLKARVIYSNGSNSSGSSLVTWAVEPSYDGGSTWVANAFTSAPVIFANASVSGTWTLNRGEVFIPFEVSETTVGTPVQVRVTTYLNSGAASGPCATGITFVSDVVPARP